MQCLILKSIPATTAMVALALGYIVVTLANKEKGGLKAIGQIIGVSIVIVSSIAILAKLLCVAATGPKCSSLLMRKMMMQQQIPPAPIK